MHAARYSEYQLCRRLAALVDIQQVGVGEVSGMPGRAQGRLQGLGIELPPEAGIDIARLQTGRRAGIVAKLVLLPGQQGVARALQGAAVTP